MFRSQGSFFAKLWSKNTEIPMQMFRTFTWCIYILVHAGAERGNIFAHTGAVAYTKNTGVFSKIKTSVFLPVFLHTPNSFRGPGGFCWRIGVTAALLGRLLPSDGHKLVKNRKFRPKSAPDRPLFDRTVFFKFVWWAVDFAQANSNLQYFEGSRSCEVLKIASSHRGERILSISQWNIEEHRR